MNILIREFQDTDPIPEITALLHRAYKPLADAGMKYVASHQDDARTLSRIKKGKCFLAIQNDRIIGTIAYYTSLHNRPDVPPIYNENGMAHFGQFAVEPGWQKQGIGSLLINHIECFALAEGNHSMSFDTAESAGHLIDYYTRKGHEFDSYHQWDMTNYRSVVMKKALSDSL